MTYPKKIPFIRVATAFAMVALLVWALAWMIVDPGGPAQPQRSASPTPTSPQQKMVQGVASPPAAEPDAGDVVPAEPSAQQASAATGTPRPAGAGYGTFPPIPVDAHPQVGLVADALRTGTHPERLSPLITPPPFDRENWERDPAAYLAVSEPGRVFQTAETDAPRLRMARSAGVVVEQGRTAVLAVRSVPGSPVTFTIFDGGLFTENSLISVTVRADEEGIARATYLATPGVIENVAVLAASPMASGQVRFRVVVTDPNHPFVASAEPADGAQR